MAEFYNVFATGNSGGSHEVINSPEIKIYKNGLKYRVTARFHTKGISIDDVDSISDGLRKLADAIEKSEYDNF